MYARRPSAPINQALDYAWRVGPRSAHGNRHVKGTHLGAEWPTPWRHDRRSSTCAASFHCLTDCPLRCTRQACERTRSSASGPVGRSILRQRACRDEPRTGLRTSYHPGGQEAYGYEGHGDGHSGAYRGDAGAAKPSPELVARHRSIPTCARPGILTAIKVAVMRLWY